MSIVTGVNYTGGKKQVPNSSYSKVENKKQASSSSYFRILLCRDLHSEGQVMYVMEDYSQNKKSWLKDTALRDNSVITIGACFVIPNPKAIKTFMEDDIPLVVTGSLFIVLKRHTLSPQVHIKMTITTTKTT